MHVDVNGTRLFFDVAGSGLDGGTEKPVLLMLHGGPGYDQMTLRPYFDRYSDIAQVVYYDHRGCGRSGGAPEGWHLDQWADNVAAFCATLGIARPWVFGQSFGGMVAMHYAARHPDGPSRLVLSSTAARFRLDHTVAMARRLGGDRAAEVAEAFFSNPTLDGYKTYAEVCLPLYTRKGAEGASFSAHAIAKPEVNVHFFRNEMMAMDLRPGIAAIACPTLVMGGTEDPVTPRICSEEIAQAIGANATLELFEGCGHGPHRDDPDGAERVMRAFLTA